MDKYAKIIRKASHYFKGKTFITCRGDTFYLELALKKVDEGKAKVLGDTLPIDLLSDINGIMGYLNLTTKIHIENTSIWVNFAKCIDSIKYNFPEGSYTMELMVAVTDRGSLLPFGIKLEIPELKKYFEDPHWDKIPSAENTTKLLRTPKFRLYELLSKPVELFYKPIECIFKITYDDGYSLFLGNAGDTFLVTDKQGNFVYGYSNAERNGISEEGIRDMFTELSDAIIKDYKCPLARHVIRFVLD